MPADKSTVADWNRRAAEYQRIIAKFEQLENDMRARRRSATDFVMVMIDERLKLNERALKSMRMGLKTAQQEIARLEAQE